MSALCAAPAWAQEPAEPAEGARQTGDLVAASDETIIVTGTRRSGRTITESSAPIDVFTTNDLASQPSGDMNTILRSMVPSFNVGRFAGVLSDGSGFVRPPTLRGLPPDETLVLVNGKRRHRSALVQVVGGDLASGAQGVDMAQIPSIAIQRIEVLRDGAAAQYGSDAIAGVFNYTLRDQREGGEIRTRYGQTYEGDGENYQAAGTIGLPLGPDGFLTLSAEYLRSYETSRGGQRPGALAMELSFPAFDIENPAQIFGDPDVESGKAFYNVGIDLQNGSELYAFGNYGATHQEYQFNYRQPYDARGPAQHGVGTQLYPKATVYNPFYLDLLPNGTRDVNGRVFTYHEIYPEGFTPRFKGDLTDFSTTVGYRGELMDGHLSGLTYDFSTGYGMSRIEYFISETFNLSMGPDSPTDFYAGSLEQRENNFNADFTYPVEIGLASPLTVAFGAEFRREAYEIGLGDEASWKVGDYQVQRLSTGGFITQPAGSNGFGGYGPDVVVDDSRDSYGVYIDLETDVTEKLTVGVAGRFENFSDFGETSNYKASGRYEFNDAIAVRAAASTGFRAPTPGQLFSTAAVTGFIGSSPTLSMTLRADDPAAQLFGATPLKPETSENLSAGIVLTPGSGLTVTLDAYNIQVDDRMGISGNTAITTTAQRDALREAGLTNWATVGQIRYFTNAFATETEGLDLVASHSLPTDNLGTFATAFAVNYNTTEVTERDPRVINDVRKGNIEESLPNTRGSITETWTGGPLSIMGRANYYGELTNWATAANGGPLKISPEFTLDFEASYSITDSLTAAVGVENALDNYPDRNIRSFGLPNSTWYVPTETTVNGSRFIDSAPFGYNGGFWYVRLGATF